MGRGVAQGAGQVELPADGTGHVKGVLWSQSQVSQHGRVTIHFHRALDRRGSIDRRIHRGDVGQGRVSRDIQYIQFGNVGHVHVCTGEPGDRDIIEGGFPRDR